MLQTSVLSLLLAVQITAEMLKAKEHLDSSPLGTWYSNGCQGKHMTIQLSCPSIILGILSYALEEEMATHPSILAWKTTFMEEPGGL